MRLLWVTLLLPVLPLLAQEVVVPLDPLTMVDPRNGHSVTGIGGDGGTAWHKSNSVWDGEKISLHGARGETLAVQLVFTDWTDHPFEGIDIDLQVQAIHDEKAWRSWCIWGTPEIAIPLKGVQTSFDLPSKIPLEAELFVSEKFSAWSAGIEFTIPRDAKPGKLAGKLRVSAKAGLTEKLFPVEIEVLPFELPVKPALLVEMNSYGDYDKFLGHGPAPYLKIQRLMREHRCSFVQVPYSQGGQLAAEFLALKVVKDPSGIAFDWKTFDETVGGLFDGTAFGDKQPVSHFTLPLCYEWPIEFDVFKRDPDKYKNQNMLARKLIAAHIREKGWAATTFAEFHNENPSQGAKCPWFLDEPRSAKDLEGHRLYSSALEEALNADSANAGIRFQYRMDVSNWKRLGDPLTNLAPRVQFWSVSRDRSYLNAASAPMFRKFADARNGLLIEYGEVSGFEADGKSINWSRFDEFSKSCWELHLDGYEQWMIDMWKCNNGQKPSVPLFYSNAAGARDLIWPGNHFGSVEPLPSLRLKAIRESLNLFDYASLALKKAPKRKDEIDAIVQALSIDSSAAHYEAKAKLAKILSE